MDAVKSSDSRDQKLIQLMQRYELPVKRMCCAFLQDASLAEDAAQETFLRAYRALDGFRSESSEKTWLMRIAVNTCKDLRRSAWHRHVDRSVTPESLPEPAVPFTEWDDAVTRAVMSLRPKHREVVLLRFYQGMTIPETAHVLGVTKSTVYNRLERAYGLLRQCLEGWNDEA